MANGALRISKTFLWLIFFMGAISLLSSEGRHDLITAMLVQIAGIIPFALLAYHVARNLTLKQAARAYLTIARIIAVSILFEQLVFIAAGYEVLDLVFLPLGGVSVNYVVNGILRASGVLYEPSQVGLLLPPALYLAIKLGDRKSMGWIIAGIIGSFSGLAFAGTAIVVFLAYFSLRHFARFVPFILLFVAVASVSNVVQDRFEKITSIVVQESMSDELDTNEINALQGSVGGLFVNALVMVQGLRDSPLIGHGLGSFAVLFPEYLGSTIQDSSSLEMLYPGQGKSLLIRILFEYGLLGISLFVFFFSRRWLSLFRNMHTLADGNLRLYWAVTSIVFFIISMIRKDAYVSFYIWFFFAIFVVATKKNGPPLYQEPMMLVNPKMKEGTV